MPPPPLPDEDEDEATIIAPSREMLASLRLGDHGPLPAAGAPAPVQPPAYAPPPLVAPPPPHAPPAAEGRATTAPLPAVTERAPGWVSATLMLCGILSVGGLALLGYWKLLGKW